MHDPLATAFTKIEAILPEETKAILSQLDESFVTRTGPFKNYKRHKELIEIVTQAQSASRCLDIEYRSFARRETTIRRVAPYRLCYFRTGLYVIGFDDRRGLPARNGRHRGCRARHRPVDPQEVLQPIDIEPDAVYAQNAFGAEISFTSQVATFDLAAVKRIASLDKKGELFIVAIGDTGEEKKFKIKTKHFDRLR